jgi:hypothetical protein
MPQKTNRSKVNRNTAFVYAGAAFLIVVVGIRTLAQTMDDGLNWIGYITIFALMLEFSLLILYATTIYKQPDESKTTSISPEINSAQIDQVARIGKTHQEFSKQLFDQHLKSLKDLQRMNQEYTLQMASYVKQLKNVIIDVEKSI